MMGEKLTAAGVWARYESGVEHHRRIDLYTRTERAHRFFLGDQWYGIEGQGRELPVMNVIAPTVKNKVATVAQGSVSINYTPIGGDTRREEQLALCRTLGEFARTRWEQFKLDSLGWRVVRDACIAGDSYLYFYDAEGRAEVLDNTNVYLGDEQCSDLQRQPYILIYERRAVSDVVREARASGLDESAVSLIRPDEEKDKLLSDQSRAEVGALGGKCTCLMLLYRAEDGFIHTLRSTRQVIYRPDEALIARDYTGRATGGLTRYPMAAFVWNPVKGSARGAGEVQAMLNNQLEINKTLARRAVSVRSFAFPKLVYDRTRVENPESLSEVGATVAVDNLSGTPVDSLITYLNPAPISGAAESLTAELIANTRELAGAGDASVGAIDPEKASGAAILAVRDLAQLPLNEQIAAYRQFAEDIAAIWYDLWRVYNPGGLTVEREDGSVVFLPAAMFDELRVGIRVDVSSDSPYSRYAEQQALDNLFSMGAITFEEYVSVLDSASALPKGKLEQIIRMRQLSKAVGIDAPAPAGADAADA